MGKHSIIIIKNKKGKYLQYYDKLWNCYLFLNCKILDENDIEPIKKIVADNLYVDIGNIKLLGIKTHKKFSESAKVEKEYTHYFYKVILNKNLKDDDFEINNIKYKWLSYDEMMNDERISKVNGDIIGFVRDLENKNGD